MGFIKALVLLIFIPALGIGVANWVLSDVESQLAQRELDFASLCSDDSFTHVSNVKALCDEVAPIRLLRRASWASAVVAVGLLLSFFFASRVAGRDREKITRIFPPLVFVSLFVLAVLVLVQGAVLTYSVYLGEVQLISTAHPGIIALVGLGALIGGWQLVVASFRLAGRQTSTVVGTALDRDTHPHLFAFVDDLSARLGARSPDHIVVGLEPNFYVSSGDMYVLMDDRRLNGETLYLSLPLSRIFTREELRGVIGHELGHFRGKDTHFSLKFSPVYAGLSHGLAALGGDNGGGALATIPARAVLNYMIEAFHTNVSAIGREREFAADRAATEVAQPLALATALLKVNLYASAWHNLEMAIVNRMSRRRGTRNMSWLFSSIVKYDVNREKIPEVIDEIGAATISHPTDSHPPTASRIEEMGLRVNDIDHELLLFSEHDNSIDLINEFCELEEKLTDLQHQYYMAIGVEVPEQEDINYGALLVAAFGAHMVLADGAVVAEEVDEAEAIGMNIVEDFDCIDFREYCHYPDMLPSLEDLFAAGDDLDQQHKDIVIDYLERIAGSDNEVSVEEAALLAKVKARFG